MYYVFPPVAEMNAERIYDSNEVTGTVIVARASLRQDEGDVHLIVLGHMSRLT